MSIEKALHHVEMLINRRLKPIETLIVGIAYQRGYLEGIEIANVENKPNEKPNEQKD